MPRILCILLLIGTYCWGQQTQTQPTVERKQIKEKIAAGETLSVTNKHGDIRARHTDAAAEFEVFAIVQNLEPFESFPSIQIEREKNVVRVEVRSEDQKDRVDLVVYVPARIPFQVSATHGLIDVRNLHTDVSAQSEKGEIHVRTAKGAVNAQNLQGHIRIFFAENATDRPQKFSTLTGDITLHFPEGMTTSVRAATSGQITTDYSIDITYEKLKEPDKTGTLKLGKGVGEIVAESKRGNIRLLRLLTSLPKAE